MWRSRDPGNELIFIINGTLEVEFEHPHIQRDAIFLYINDYIGDMALLGTTALLALLALLGAMKRFSKHADFHDWG
jgi:hypothetical protein